MSSIFIYKTQILLRCYEKKVESVKLGFADKNMTIIIVLWCFVDKKQDCPQLLGTALSLKCL